MTSTSNINKLLSEIWTLRRQGNYQEALLQIKEAERLCDFDDYNSLGRIFHIYMQIESDHDHYSEALNLCKQSLNYYIKGGDTDKIAHSTRHVADLERCLEFYSESEINYRAAIKSYRDNDNTSKGDLANTLRGFGLLLEKTNNTSEAFDVWKEVKELYQDCQLQAGVDEANNKLNTLK